MGLDISWYRGLTESPNEPLEDDGEIIDWKNATRFYIHPNPSWQSYASDLKADMAYRYEESGGFRAGSYGGYSQFRSQLQRLAGFDKLEWRDIGGHTMKTDDPRCETLPFFELCCFSDCEGSLGSATCAHLAKDFQDNQSAAEEFSKTLGDEDAAGWFMIKYAEWLRAFERCGERGAVRFH